MKSLIGCLLILSGCAHHQPMKLRSIPMPVMTVSSDPNPSAFGKTVNLLGSVEAIGTTLPSPLGTLNYNATSLSVSFYGCSGPTLCSNMNGMLFNPAISGPNITFNPPVSLGTSNFNPVSQVGGTLLPTGTVKFSDGSTVLGNASLVNGTATVSVTLGTGLHTLTAVYSGDANYSSVTAALTITK